MFVLIYMIQSVEPIMKEDENEKLLNEDAKQRLI